ncbi:phytoene desaturase family protein [Sphingobacterium bovistauri]|uniref:Phytoene desaturase n=1 Tax=Sphingobacterium bovistauri TaxID=2781959 RepID=A0ABS7ZA00_9SPHI|nr:phytoene desaturase family protein [Sphingobacterium bovistauri]MCA5005754.1 phytoene desaturase [Sphingobacterium bovistauri]
MHNTKKHNKKVAILGAGFSGLSAACYAAKKGHEVHVYEKHETAGGRARQFKANGFTFDMGPSWYWMPDVFDDFFSDFGHQTKDFYELKSLNPQFEIIFKDSKISVPEKYEELRNLFESIESGAAKKLDSFMTSAQHKYEIGMKQFIHKPCHTWTEFISINILKNATKLDLLSNFDTYVNKFFTDTRLKMIMEFPVIFLGAAPSNIPALYSLMNYGGYALGTWYPMGGFYEVIKSMQKLAEELGVNFHFNSEVDEIITESEFAKSIRIDEQHYNFDEVISSIDYHHTEKLLPENKRNYSDKYWETRTFAPSCLIFYIGIKGEIPNLKHHTLFFEHELDEHIADIYVNKEWPENPLFYVCCPSKTDPTVAPENHENLFLLLPIANNIEDNEQIREVYFNKMLTRLEKHIGENNLLERIVYKRSYCVEDFKEDYHAYGGNAYGLANTLKQTAILKPAIRNKKLKNLHYTGQLTVPGPGVPPSIISGKIVANEI